MTEIVQNPLVDLSNALAERARLARPLIAAIAAGGHRIRTGTLWRKDVVVASEQRFPDLAEVEVRLADGAGFAARVAGRDPGTNVIAFKLDGTPDPTPAAAAEPQPGALALAVGAADEGVSVRIGVVHSVGPAWHSRAGGRIDRRITLDIDLGRGEEGGPVLDASGGVLGISALGPRGRVLVIPASTIDAVLEPLLSRGRVDRGWLGLALQPVLVPEALQGEAGSERGLMIMGVAKDSPAARANLHTGDILVTVAGEDVASPAALARRLGPDSVGAEVELRVLRAGQPVSVSLTVGPRPAA